MEVNLKEGRVEVPDVSELLREKELQRTYHYGVDEVGVPEKS